MFGPAATQYHVLMLFLFCLTYIALYKLHKWLGLKGFLQHYACNTKNTNRPEIGHTHQ